MAKRGELKPIAPASYTEVSPNSDSFGTLWERRVVLDWYPGKTSDDAFLAAILHKNINWKTGEFQINLRDKRGHSLRSLSAITGISKDVIADTLERWVDLKMIERYSIGHGRSGTLTINWHTLRQGLRPRKLSVEQTKLSPGQTDKVSPQATVLSPQQTQVSADQTEVALQETVSAPLYKDNILSSISVHLGGGATAASYTPLAGANSSEKSSGDHQAGTGSSEVPPMSPQARIADTTKETHRVVAASFGPGVVTDLNNLNPHAASVRNNRRYGALTALDGSEGVHYDIQLGKLSLVNGTLAAFQANCAERGLDLSAALVKAATRVAKDPRNATPTMVLAEINQALAYQEQDKRSKGSGSGLKFNRNPWGRGGIRQL